MAEDLKKLELENRRLSKLAETDWLTGVYNRGGTERRVNEALEKYHTGVMLVLDVDHFKQVNDRFGHIAGDQVLKEIAETLSRMFFRNDIIGRIGGDEFVVFIPVNQDMDFINERCQQIKNRFRDIKLPKALSITVCGALYQDGDDYLRMFDRADQLLINEKKRRSGKEGKLHKMSAQEVPGVDIDMKQICEELRETDRLNGALCQDYETFKNIYCFTERRLRRTKGNACIILFTITDGSNNFPSYAVREDQMGTLAEIIQECLRVGDVFTQYSSCQYLTMVSDASMDNVDCIAERISSRFYEQVQGGQNKCLLHHGYPLGNDFLKD